MCLKSYFREGVKLSKQLSSLKIMDKSMEEIKLSSNTVEPNINHSEILK